MFEDKPGCLRDRVASLDIEGTLEKLKGLAKVSDMETLRMEYLHRYINIGIVGCKIGQLGKAIPSTFTKHADLMKQTAAMKQFLTHDIRDRWHSMECPCLRGGLRSCLRESLFQ